MIAMRQLPILATMLSLAVLPATALASGHGGGGEGGGISLVEMKPIDVPIVEGNRSDARLRLKLVLRAADAPGAAKITTDMPALREAALAGASEFARLHASPYVAVDAEMLVHDLTATLHHRDPGITAVLLVEVVASAA
ncbi:hypothetical protein [Sphingomonas mollis]|uniref:Flagellar protein FliL n=1 Tax=Sphingomonas mollis TaxID=2795726 RepID=A0ABS0XSI9_9SPHN|nr:hypothetical protein [Sphingomonas sp. BT553]MBJ6123009.1 hypothetical protein [Sphingomonas sp. BT553]